MTPTFEGDTTALFAALAKAQAEMTSAKKDKTNSFFKSKYADLASVLKACRSALNENGLSLTQWPDFDPDRNMVTMHTVLGHAGGGRIECASSMVPNKSDNQGVGSCQSYLRRYSIQAILAIPAADDDGEAAMGRGGSPQAVTKPKPRPNPKARPKAKPRPPAPVKDKHDPSWEPARMPFCSSLTDIGWTYEQAAFIASANNRPRPSGMTQAARMKLLDWLAALSHQEAAKWRRRYAQDKEGAPTTHDEELF